MPGLAWLKDLYNVVEEMVLQNAWVYVDDMSPNALACYEAKLHHLSTERHQLAGSHPYTIPCLRPPNGSRFSCRAVHRPRKWMTP